MALAPMFSLLFVFALALLIGFLLYGVGDLMSPKTSKPKKNSSKLEPYACGEPLPAQKFQMNFQRFFLYATFFMIFDISAFILALSFTADALYPILFCAITTVNLVALIPVFWRKRK